MRQKSSLRSISRIGFILLQLILLLLIPFLGIYGMLLFVAVIALKFMLPTPQRRFMRYQQSLPTSKVRSMATGLVELEGKLVSQQLIRAPLSGRRCIGFSHTISEEERDSRGNTRYRLIHEEKHCAAFMLQDGTGKVQIDASSLDFFLLPVGEETRTGRQILREYRLEAGEEYLLIGQAVRQGSEVVITRDRLRRIFGIAPVGNLKRREKLDVVFGRARYYAVATALFIALMLVLPVEVQHRQVIIHYSHLLPSLDWSSPRSGSAQ